MIQYVDNIPFHHLFIKIIDLKDSARASYGLNNYLYLLCDTFSFCIYCYFCGYQFTYLNVELIKARTLSFVTFIFHLSSRKVPYHNF